MGCNVVGFNNNICLLQLCCYPVAVVILHVNKTWNCLLLNLCWEGKWEACSGNLESWEPSQHLLLGTGKPRKKNLCGDGRSQDLLKLFQSVCRWTSHYCSPDERNCTEWGHRLFPYHQTRRFFFFHMELSTAKRTVLSTVLQHLMSSALRGLSPL